MTQSRIFYNVHGDAPNFSLSLLWAHIKDLNPKWLLIMNATRAAIETAQRYPQTQVIMRSYVPEDDSPLKVWGTWSAFLAHVKQDLKSSLRLDETLPPNLWIYTNNESGDSNELHDYLTGLISQPELKFVVGNYSVGTPQISRWKQLAPFLRLLDEQRHRVVLGLHEYFCGVPTTGLIGGPPTELKDEHGNVIHPDYTKRANWPADVKGLTKWHCGRFEFLVAACKELGIRPPRVVLTEHGSDDLDDINAWADALPKTHPYTEIRGFRTLWNAWRSIENNPNLDVDKHFADCLTYLDEHVYKDSIVEAQLVFSMFSKPQWAQFDISGTDVPHHLAEYARAQTPTPPPPVEPPVEPKPEPPPVTKVISKHVITVTGTDLHAVSSVDTVLRLFAQAMGDGLVIEGVDEIKVTNGE